MAGEGVSWNWNWKSLFPGARSSLAAVKEVSKGLSALSAASHLLGASCQVAGWDRGLWARPRPPLRLLRLGKWNGWSL